MTGSIGPGHLIVDTNVTRLTYKRKPIIRIVADIGINTSFSGVLTQPLKELYLICFIILKTQLYLQLLTVLRASLVILRTILIYTGA